MLNKLLKPGELVPFVDAHTEFAHETVDDRLRISFAKGAGSGVRPSSANGTEAAPSHASVPVIAVASKPASASADIGEVFEHVE